MQIRLTYKLNINIENGSKLLLERKNHLKWFSHHKLLCIVIKEHIYTNNSSLGIFFAKLLNLQAFVIIIQTL